MAHLRVTGTDFDELMKAKPGKIGHNTYLHQIKDSKYTDDHAAITLHNTVIVRVYRDRIEYNTGGYNTVTTKERMNQFVPPGRRVTQKDFEWYFDGVSVDREWVWYRLPVDEPELGMVYLPRPLVEA